MGTVAETVDLTLDDADRLRKLLKRGRSVQVTSPAERALIKGNTGAWFNAHRGVCAVLASSPNFERVDGSYKRLMECSDRATSRSIYDGILKGLRANLIALRSEAVVGPNATATSDDPPTFVPLVTDPKMQSILTDRWKECVSCLGNNAPLAAVVMMGGLLEALLLTRINREVDPAPVYKALAAPKDKAGKTQPLKEWTLKSYIEVAHELKWITVAARDVGAVLRDYRNYIHPFKQLSHGVNLTPDDSRLLWEIAKEVSKQVVKGVHP